MSKHYAKLSPKNEQRYYRNQSSSKSGYFVLFILIIVGITAYYLFSHGILSSKSRTGIATSVKEKKAPAQPVKPRFEFYTLLSQETVPVPHDKTTTTNHPVTADATTSADEVAEEANMKKTDTENAKNGDNTQNAESSANETTQNNATPETAPTGVPSIPVQSKSKHSKPLTAAAASPQKATTAAIQPSAPAPLPSTATIANTPKTTSSNRYVLQVAALQHPNDVEQLKAKLSLLGFAVSIEPFQRNNTLWYRVKVGPFLSPEDLQRARQRLASNRLSGIVITLPAATST